MNFKNINYIVLIFSLLLFITFTFITLRLNIHGDSKFHTLYAKESSELGYLVAEQPRRIYTIEGNQRIYMPIAYPLTSESLFTIFYLFGGELFLKLYSPIFAVLIFLLLFLTIKEIGQIKAILISSIAVLTISERLIMTPLIEPYILLLTLSSIFILKLYFKTNETKYLFISSVFLGASAAVKQQGILFTLFILVFLFGVELIYKPYFKKVDVKKQILKYFNFLLIVVIIPSLAIYNQIGRTGTFAYSPGKTEIPLSTPFYNVIQPLLASKYETNREAQQAMAETITYNRGDKSLINKVRGFLLAPFLFYRSINTSFQTTIYVQLFLISIVIIGFSLFVKKSDFLENKIFIVLLFFSILAEIASSTVLKTPITQYHVLGVILSTLVIFNGITLLSKRFAYLSITSFSIFFLAFIVGYFNYIFPLWSDNGREDPYHLEGYKRIGTYVNSNTPNDAIFLAGETSFRYYSKRDTVWLNEGVGYIVKSAIYSSEESEILDNLKRLNVSYIVVNKAQTQRYGVNDFLPANKMVSIIDKSDLFLKVFDAYGDGEMSVYKVNYQF